MLGKGTGETNMTQAGLTPTRTPTRPKEASLTLRLTRALDRAVTKGWNSRVASVLGVATRGN